MAQSFLQPTESFMWKMVQLWIYRYRLSRNMILEVVSCIRRGLKYSSTCRESDRYLSILRNTMKRSRKPICHRECTHFLATNTTSKSSLKRIADKSFWISSRRRCPKELGRSQSSLMRCNRRWMTREIILPRVPLEWEDWKRILKDSKWGTKMK